MSGEPSDRTGGVLAAAAVAAVTAGVAVAGSLGGDFESRWYRRLRKPDWQPSGRTIATVWTGLYALTAISCSLLVRRTTSRAPLIRSLFAAQYALNAAFTPILTRRRALGLATADSALLCATLAALAAVSWPVGRLASALLLPSVGWTAFATYLSWTLLRLNRR